MNDLPYNYSKYPTYNQTEKRHIQSWSHFWACKKRRQSDFKRFETSQTIRISELYPVVEVFFHRQSFVCLDKVLISCSCLVNWDFCRVNFIGMILFSKTIVRTFDFFCIKAVVIFNVQQFVRIKSLHIP